MRTKRLLMLLGSVCLALMLAVPFVAGCAAPAPTPAVQYAWKYASPSPVGGIGSVWGYEWAEIMREKTNGQIEISVFPGGTLGKIRDINEAAQVGNIEFVFTDMAWLSGFVPEVQVFALHYLWPQQKTGEVITEVAKNGKIMGLIEESARAKGLQPLAFLTAGWQWFTGNKWLKHPDDFKGLKFRVMESKILVEDYRAYGANPTTLGYYEIYGALQTGLIEAQVNTMKGCYEMKFWEVQDYFVNAFGENYIGIVCANRDFFDGLPKDIQEMLVGTWTDLIAPIALWNLEVERESIESIKEQRPMVQFYELTGEEMEPFKPLAKSVYQIYEEIGGERAPEMLATLLADIEAAKAKLGVEY